MATQVAELACDTLQLFVVFSSATSLKPNTTTESTSPVSKIPHTADTAFPFMTFVRDVADVVRDEGWRGALVEACVGFSLGRGAWRQRIETGVLLGVRGRTWALLGGHVRREVVWSAV